MMAALTRFDFSAIEELDPSVSDGYRVMFDRECPFEVKTPTSISGAAATGGVFLE